MKLSEDQDYLDFGTAVARKDNLVAAQHLSKVIERVRTSGDAHQLAFIYRVAAELQISMGLTALAEKSIESSLSVDPLSAQSRYYAALFYLEKLKDTQKAMTLCGDQKFEGVGLSNEDLSIEEHFKQKLREMLRGACA